MNSADRNATRDWKFEAPQTLVPTGNCAPEKERVAKTPCTLSIIVPTFNSSKTIMRCLESIGGQSFKDYELLIQDNYSTDGTLDLVRTFCSTRPATVIRCVQEADRGVYDAMNKAMQRSSGEWLLFLGSDDALHDEQVLAKVMSTSQVVTSDFLYGNVEAVGDSQMAASGDTYDGPFDLEKLLSKNICHQAIFYRSSLIKKVGLYNTKYPICADWDYNLRCWSWAKTSYLDVVVAYFSAGGISSQSDRAFEKDFRRNVHKYGLLNDMLLLDRVTYILRPQIDRAKHWLAKAKRLWSKDPNGSQIHSVD